MPRAARRAAAVCLAVLVMAGAAWAQRGFGGGGGRFYFREGTYPTIPAPEQMPDASFVLCRLAYRQSRREPSGIGWQTDYPYAEINLSTRLGELTKTRISRNDDGEPRHFVVNLRSDTIFNCPVVLASDAGTITIADEDAERLRNYLLKGGFFWADDFWGSLAWEHFVTQISKALPPAEFPIEDVAIGDPMLHSQFELKEIPQITNIQFWRGSGGRETSERGADSAEVHLRAIRDPKGRIMVLMSHNTDVADSWEREGEDPEFFYQFSPGGYALGIDVMLHVMTH